MTRDQLRFAENALRRASHKWPAFSEAKERARVGRETDFRTGRECYQSLCGLCGGKGFEKEMHLDHKTPVVPVGGRDSLEGFAERLLCGVDGLQMVHKTCHNGKTQDENRRRK